MWTDKRTPCPCLFIFWSFCKECMVQTYVKVKVISSLCTPWRNRRGVDLYFLTFLISVWGECSASSLDRFTSEGDPQHPLNGRVRGPQNRSVCFGKKKNLFPVPEIWSRFIVRPVRSRVTGPTELFLCPLICRNILPWISIITAVCEGRHVPVTLWLTNW